VTGPGKRKLVGIIGAGRLGQAIARTAPPRPRDHQQSWPGIADVSGLVPWRVSADTVDEAVAAGIVVIAVLWDRVPAAVQGLDWNTR
jgi:predicted dinucleotide-binding enzyme